MRGQPLAKEILAKYAARFDEMADARRLAGDVAGFERWARLASSDPAARELDTPEPRPAPEPATAAAESPGSRGAKTFEFRTDDWSEAYSRRIDDTPPCRSDMVTASSPTRNLFRAHQNRDSGSG